MHCCLTPHVHEEDYLQDQINKLYHQAGQGCQAFFWLIDRPTSPYVCGTPLRHRYSIFVNTPTLIIPLLVGTLVYKIIIISTHFFYRLQFACVVTYVNRIDEYLWKTAIPRNNEELLLLMDKEDWGALNPNPVLTGIMASQFEVRAPFKAMNFTTALPNLDEQQLGRTTGSLPLRIAVRTPPFLVLDLIWGWLVIY